MPFRLFVHCMLNVLFFGADYTDYAALLQKGCEMFCNIAEKPYLCMQYAKHGRRYKCRTGKTSNPTRFRLRGAVEVDSCTQRVSSPCKRPVYFHCSITFSCVAIYDKRAAEATLLKWVVSIKACPSRNSLTSKEFYRIVIH